jgi:hypothetical protein
MENLQYVHAMLRCCNMLTRVITLAIFRCCLLWYVPTMMLSRGLVWARVVSFVRVLILFCPPEQSPNPSWAVKSTVPYPELWSPPRFVSACIYWLRVWNLCSAWLVRTFFHVNIVLPGVAQKILSYDWLALEYIWVMYTTRSKSHRWSLLLIPNCPVSYICCVRRSSDLPNHNSKPISRALLHQTV